VTRPGAVAAAALLAGVAAPAQAAISVDGFLAKAAALQAKGAMALFSSDLGVLKRETRDAMAALKADKTARAAAGRPPLYCAPKDARMGAAEFVGGLRALPEAERRLPLKDGVVRMLARKWPCAG
jgi:hypothetical protein